jgi:hypothetical protein
MATSSDVKMPKLAPAPMKLDAHSHPWNCWNAVEKGASESICHQRKKESLIRPGLISLSLSLSLSEANKQTKVVC